MRSLPKCEVKFEPKNSNGVICAECVTLDEQKCLMGVLSFTFDTNTQILRSKLTVVDSEHRRRGVASLLWSETLLKYSPKLVSVSIVSNGGEGLIQSLKKKFPNIEWDIW